MSDLTIPARDGYRLAASQFLPSGTPKATVLFAPATGVKRSVYRGMAEHFAAAGFAAVTWDWRGTGGSKPATLKGFPGDMRTWAEQDLAGVIDWSRVAMKDVPLVGLGHSFGGQAWGLAGNGDRMAAIVNVAAQSGYIGNFPLHQRLAYEVLFRVLMPGLTGLIGWFPSKRLGMGEDLPPGVARQWSKWCTTPDYLGDWAGHTRMKTPMLVWGSADDPYASPKSIAALHDHYISAQQQRRIITPREANVRRIGHFGFFKPGLPALWDETIAWIQGTLNSSTVSRAM